MARAKKDDSVRIHYIGKLRDGAVFGSSEGQDPLEFTIGSNTLIAGLEDAVARRSPGEHTPETIPANEAFGPLHNELVVEIDRSQFPTKTDPVVREKSCAFASGRDDLIMTVIDVSGDRVTVANHPLAGQDLIFELEIVEIV